MIIRYSDKTYEIEIAATEQELLELATKLVEDKAEIESDIEGYDIHPYSRFLSGIQVSIVPRQRVEFQLVCEKQTVSTRRQAKTVDTKLKAF